MIKLIAIDLDGTMYTTEQKITSGVRKALTRAVENGVQPVIVTGRGKNGAEIALNSLEMNFPYICAAGALIRSGLDGDTIQARTFHSHSEMMKIINFTRKNNIGIIAEPHKSGAYWFGPDSMNAIMDPLTIKEAYNSIRTFEPEKDFNQPLLKATITAKVELLSEAEKLLKEECPSIHYVSAGIQYIDLTADGVNKGSALKTLAESLKLQPHEIAAIGDQAIDLKMLQYAGLPIAMTNGVSALKEAANWIAPSNDEDGVAWAIDNILKLNAQN